jgi:hypothetical protein
LASVRVKSGAALRLISDDDAAGTGDDGAQPVSSAHAKTIRASTVSEAGGVMAESYLHLSFVEVNHGVTRGGSQSVLLNGKRDIGLPACLSNCQDHLGNGIFCNAVIAPLFCESSMTSDWHWPASLTAQRPIGTDEPGGHGATRDHHPPPQSRVGLAAYHSPVTRWPGQWLPLAPEESQQGGAQRGDQDGRRLWIGLLVKLHPAIQFRTSPSALTVLSQARLHLGEFATTERQVTLVIRISLRPVIFSVPRTRE